MLTYIDVQAIFVSWLVTAFVYLLIPYLIEVFVNLKFGKRPFKSIIIINAFVFLLVFSLDSNGQPPNTVAAIIWSFLAYLAMKKSFGSTKHENAQSSDKHIIKTEIQRFLNDSNVSVAARKDALNNAISLLNETPVNDLELAQFDGLKEQAVNILSESLYIYVVSGKYHYHSGVLNPIGSDMLMLYQKCLDYFMQIGKLTGDEHEQLKNSICEIIKIVG